LFLSDENSYVFLDFLVLLDKNNIMGIDEYLKQEGREEGREEGNEKAVKLLLDNTEFSMSKIAELVGVSVSFVKKVKETLSPRLQAK
jgi:predicted transposase YdaD